MEPMTTRDFENSNIVVKEKIETIVMRDDKVNSINKENIKELKSIINNQKEVPQELNQKEASLDTYSDEKRLGKSWLRNKKKTCRIEDQFTHCQQS